MRDVEVATQQHLPPVLTPDVPVDVPVDVIAGAPGAGKNFTTVSQVPTIELSIL